ncbi:hypothetical protein SCHPADRAFT_902697 [Schizopora paradoxa]|uniref:BTB domain-containing protein n=1 Tax=Schizopora paradoxa TaxID=27342 RepID=A0A0H2RU66_9AGAM|nr:hypothetical protein SCHPADRAFT_902697 [Schizopora paradoxa]
MSDTSSESKHSRGSRRRSSRHSTSSVVKFDDIDTKREAHPVFSFPDGNVTFLVEGTTFTVYRYFLQRDSPVFRDMFALGAPLDDGQGLSSMEGSKENPVRLPDLNPNDFARFLCILFPPRYNVQPFQKTDDWIGVLRVADKFQFADVRELAVEKLRSAACAVDRIHIGHRYSVRSLALSGYRDLCNRRTPLTVEEIDALESCDIALVMSKRESLGKNCSYTHYQKPLDHEVPDSAVAKWFANRLPPENA